MENRPRPSFVRISCRHPQEVDKNAHLFTHIDASDLNLWKICRPIDDPGSKQPQTGSPLNVNKRFSASLSVIRKIRRLLWRFLRATTSLSSRTSSRRKKAPHFNRVAASDLGLWKVSFPIDDLTSKQPPTLGPSLRPHRLLSDLFTSVLEVGHIHIALPVPKIGMCYIIFYDFFIISRQGVSRLMVHRSRRLHI